MMQTKDVKVYMVFVLLFCSLLGNGLEDRKLIRGLISGLRLDSASEESDENLVEIITANCRHELIQLKQICENLGLCIDNTLSSNTGATQDDQSLAEENVKNALSNLHPLIKERVFKCLKANIHIRPISGEDVSPGSWYLKNLKSLLTKSNARSTSRYLAEALSPTKSSTMAPAPAPSPFPSALAPGARSLAKSKDSPSEDQLVIPIDAISNSPPAKGKGDPKKKSDGDHTTIIAAIAATAGATFVIAILLFVCCRKACGGGGASSELKDDRPLLSLSMSESVNGNYQSFLSSNLSDKKTAGSFNDNLLGASMGANPSGSGLKPPRGRTSVSSSGLPPLKPPPGRTDLLPPEPPASLKPPPGVAAPPPPPLPPPKAPAAPPPPPKKPPGPPPPPGKGGPRAPPLPKGGSRPPPPVAVKAGSTSHDGDGKTKLKPFFWDKVMANPDESMVWNQIKSGSFQFNEEMIESLFGFAAVENKDKKNAAILKEQPQYIQIVEHKKAQNLSILLRALNVTTDEVRDALLEGNELPSELLETLIRMAPTSEEELKLRLYNGPIEQLGPAERFLKVLVDIPFAVRRLEALLFMGSLQEETKTVKESFVTLEAACKELRGSRLFLKLLEAVLKTGNRMNDGTYRGGAQAFKLDTLLKLSDVKGTDRKTTLLHFVVQEIIRSEGVRAARAFRESKSISSIKSEDLMEDVGDESEDHFRALGLQAVSGLGDQLQNVRKAACLDGDAITGTVAKLGTALIKTRDFLNKNMKDADEEKGFHEGLKSFVEHAEGEVTWLLEEEKRIMALVKKTGDYFHGNSGKEEGLRLFVIVRDFLIMLEKVCREVKERQIKFQKKDPPSRQSSSAAETPRTPATPDFRQKLFPAIAERRADSSRSGSDSDDD